MSTQNYVIGNGSPSPTLLAKVNDGETIDKPEKTEIDRFDDNDKQKDSGGLRKDFQRPLRDFKILDLEYHHHPPT